MESREGRTGAWEGRIGGLGWEDRGLGREDQGVERGRSEGLEKRIRGLRR